MAEGKPKLAWAYKRFVEHQIIFGLPSWTHSLLSSAAEEERVVEPSARQRHRSKRAPKLLLLLLPVVGAGEGTALRCQASFRTKDD